MSDVSRVRMQLKRLRPRRGVTLLKVSRVGTRESVYGVFDSVHQSADKRKEILELSDGGDSMSRMQVTLTADLSITSVSTLEAARLLNRNRHLVSELIRVSKLVRDNLYA